MAFDPRTGARASLRVEHAADARIGRARLRDDVAHEADDEYREDEDGEVAVERREVAERHGSDDDEMPAERQDDERREVGAQGDDRDEAREQPQDAHADILGFRVRREELLVFVVLRIEEPDERRPEDALVDDRIEPVDGFLRAREELAHMAEHVIERTRDDRHDREHGEPEPPVKQQEQYGRADDEEPRRDERGDGLRHERFHRVDIGRQVGEELARADAVDVFVRLHGYLRRDAVAQVPRHALGRVYLHDVLPVREGEDERRDGGEFLDEPQERETAERIGVDGVLDELRHQEVEPVAEDGQQHQERDDARVRA